METTAIHFSRLRQTLRIYSTSSSGDAHLLTAHTRLADFLTLMKPRVMLLAVFTAFVGLIIATAHLDPLLGSIAVFAIATGAGAASVLNRWYDADSDAAIARTAMRPIPRGRDAPVEAFVFGLVLAGCAVAVVATAANVKAAALLAFTIFFYIVVYTVWPKRHTPLNIVMGGAAGALPPVIGWVAATGDIAREPLILFLMISISTPPHFWALWLNRVDEYDRAGVPVLPVVAGRVVTARQNLVYSVHLVPISLLPRALGFAGALYGAVALVRGAILVLLALRLRRGKCTDRRAAHRLFMFSISYLLLLFAAVLVGDRWSSTLPRDAGAARSFTNRRSATPRPNRMQFCHCRGRRGLTCAAMC
jgi:heme o synthase